MMGYGVGGGTFMFWLWSILMHMVLPLIIIVCLVWLAARLLNRTERSPKSAEKKDSPLDILQARYARGEIDHDEYRKIKEELTRT